MKLFRLVPHLTHLEIKLGSFEATSFDEISLDPPHYLKLESLTIILHTENFIFDAIHNSLMEFITSRRLEKLVMYHVDFESEILKAFLQKQPFIKHLEIDATKARRLSDFLPTNLTRLEHFHSCYKILNDEDFEFLIANFKTLKHLKLKLGVDPPENLHRITELPNLEEFEAWNPWNFVDNLSHVRSESITSLSCGDFVKTFDPSQIAENFPNLRKLDVRTTVTLDISLFLHHFKNLEDLNLIGNAPLKTAFAINERSVYPKMKRMQFSLTEDQDDADDPEDLLNLLNLMPNLENLSVDLMFDIRSKSEASKIVNILKEVKYKVKLCFFTLECYGRETSLLFDEIHNVFANTTMRQAEGGCSIITIPSK